MKYTFILIPFLVSVNAFSQTKETDTLKSCIAQWRKGENRILQIIHTKESREANKIRSSVKFFYEAHITVLDSTKEGYTMQWEFRLPENVIKTNPKLVDSLPVYAGLKMIYKTTTTGIFSELINWQEVKEAYVKMMEISLPKNLDDSAKAILDKTKEMFNSKEMVEAALIKEIILFHFPYGATFSTKEIKIKTEISNPIFPEPLPAFQTVKITEPISEKDIFKVSIKQDIDSVSAVKIIEGIIKKMNLISKDALEESKEILSKFVIKDYSEYSIIESSGWIKKCDINEMLKAMKCYRLIPI